MPAKPEPAHTMLESSAKMAGTSEPCHVMATTPEPRPNMAATPEPRYAMATVQVCPMDFFGWYYRTQAPAYADLGPRQIKLMASIMDPPMMSV